MKVTIEIDEIQEGKQYTIDFCISEDGSVKKTNKVKTTNPSVEKKKGPSLDDFEEVSRKPSLDDVPVIKKKMSDFKIESSFGNDKISES